MHKIFESDLKRGFLDLFEQEETLFAVSGFNRSALGVYLELPAKETADLAEALLRHLDEPTRLSVIESILGKKNKESQDASPVCVEADN